MSLFDIEAELVVVCVLGEIVGGAKDAQEAVEGGWFEQGKPAYQCFIESEVDVLILFFEQQSFLEGQHATVASEAEHIDQFLQIESHAHAVLRRDGGDAGFAVIEDLGIVESVLDRVLSIIARPDLHFPEDRDVDLEGYIELQGVGDAQYRKLLGAFAQVAEPDRIGFADADLVESISIGDRAPARGGLYAHGFHGVVAGAVEDETLDRILLGEERGG